MSARKPDVLKLIAGTDRRDRMSAEKPLPALTSAPARPSWLTGVEGVREWNRLSKLMMKNQMLNGGNCHVLGHFCGLHDAMSKAWLSETVPTAALMQTYRTLAASLGLLSLSAPMKNERPANRFANNAAHKNRA